MKSKPKTIDFNREYTPDGKDFTVYYFDIEFENGTKGQFSTNKREQDKFTIGSEVEFTVTEKRNQKGPYNMINVVKEERAFGGRRFDKTRSERMFKNVILKGSMKLGIVSKDYTYDKFLTSFKDLAIALCGEISSENEDSYATFNGAINAMVDINILAAETNMKTDISPEDMDKAITAFYNYVKG